jgi:hypothetical protein
VNPHKHKAYLDSLVKDADAALARIVVAQDKLRRLERELRSLNERADDLENRTVSSRVPLVDMIADDVRGRGADVLRSCASVSRTALEMARASADSALKVRNAMERAAHLPARRVGAWSDRREMKRSLATVQAWAVRCEDAVEKVTQAQDRIKFEF